MIRRGADTNRKNELGETLIHFCRENIEILHALIQPGADNNSKNYDGDTILRVHISHPDSIRWLIDDGANVDIRPMLTTQPSTGRLSVTRQRSFAT